MLNHYCAIRCRKINAYQSTNGEVSSTLPVFNQCYHSPSTPRRIDGRHYHFFRAKPLRRLSGQRLFRMGRSIHWTLLRDLTKRSQSNQNNGAIPCLILMSMAGFLYNKKLILNRSVFLSNRLLRLC